MPKYQVQHDYKEGLIPIFSKGMVVELTEDEAAWYNRNSPGVVVMHAEAPARQAPPAPHNRMMKIEPLTRDEPKEVDATPSAKKLAEEHGIDLSDIDGSGAGGRVLKSDVTALIDE